MTTAAAQKTETVVLLPVGRIHKSPTQPRRRKPEKLDSQFVASIKEKGVLQPIVVRARLVGDWEIVFGHRRHEGAQLAGLEEIPALVRELSDEDVFEAQLIENIHREDMHPLDEAHGFKRMMEHGRSIQQIADRIGRPVVYVTQRLKLTELAKETKAALDKDAISLGVALEISRVPASLQGEALKGLTLYGRQPTAADARRTIAESYLLRLKDAPFDTADAKLVPAAGACTSCPKRTGQQRDLFPDAAADLCIDRACFQNKQAAIWKIRVKEAKAGGRPVLEGKAAEKALGYNSGYTNLDEEQYIGGNYKKPRSLFGKGEELPPITLALNKQTGAIVELIATKDFRKVERKYSKSERAERSKPGSVVRESEKEALQAAAVNLAIAGALENIDRITDNQLVRLLTEALIEMSWEHAEAIVARRELDKPPEGKKKPKTQPDPSKLLRQYIVTLTDPEDVASVGLELVLREAAPAGKYKKATTTWDETLKDLGVSFKFFEAKAVTDAKAKKEADAKAKAEAKKAAKLKKTAPKKKGK